MATLKKILKNILFVTLPMMIIFFILLEIISRIFFPGSEAPNCIFDQGDHIVKFDRKYGTRGLWTKGNLSQQRGEWRINNDGWNSPIDYVAEKTAGVKRIAVIGDSYIEAWQVDAEKSYPSLLRDSLGSKYQVYSFGVSQSPLSQYLFVSRYVEKKYNPDVYIINLVHNDFHESINGMAYIPMYMTVKLNPDSSFTEVQPVEPERTYNKVPMGELFRKSSFFRYVYYNLNLMERFKAKKAAAKEFEMNVAVSDVMDKKDSLRAVTSYIFRTFRKELANKEVIFVMDAPRQNIYAGDLPQSKTAWLNQMVDSLCRQEQFSFVDLTAPMDDDFRKNGKHFESKYDNHWDYYGHQFVAGVVYQYFKNKH